MISDKEVQHIANLVRIELKKEEAKKMQKELSLVLDYVEKLKKIDVSKVKIDFGPVKIENVFRRDFPEKEDEARIKKIIKMIPEKEENYAKVKSILK